MRDLSGLSPAPSESRKVHRFRAAQDSEEQASSSYCLPIDSALDDIFEILMTGSLLQVLGLGGTTGLKVKMSFTTVLFLKPS